MEDSTNCRLIIGKEVVNKHGLSSGKHGQLYYVFSNTYRHLKQSLPRVKIRKVLNIAKLIAYQGSFVITATKRNIKKLYFCSP